MFSEEKIRRDRIHRVRVPPAESRGERGRDECGPYRVRDCPPRPGWWLCRLNGGAFVHRVGWGAADAMNAVPTAAVSCKRLKRTHVCMHHLQTVPLLI